MSVRSYSSRSPRGTDSGAHWISYSDMMASMLMVFVLAVVYSVWQYFNVLDQKTQELDAKQLALTQAQEEAEAERRNNETIRIQLKSKEEELESNRIILLSQQEELNSKEAELKLAQDELARQTLILQERENEVRILQANLAATQEQIETLVGIRPKIIKDLRGALAANHIDATIDEKTGDIKLRSNVFFDSGNSKLKPSGLELIDQFLPIYLGVLMRPEYRNYVAEIIIEGHTDSDGDYESNLELSQKRALEVAKYCLRMPGLSAEMRNELQRIMTATGRSESDLVFDSNGREDKDASRRVEFKFRLIDTQMLEQMNDLFSQTDEMLVYP